MPALCLYIRHQNALDQVRVETEGTTIYFDDALLPTFSTDQLGRCTRIETEIRHSGAELPVTLDLPDGEGALAAAVGKRCHALPAVPSPESLSHLATPHL